MLVNAAGHISTGTIENTSLDAWDKMMNVNVRASFQLMQKALPSLIERRGNIVNVSSVTGLRAFPGVLAYCVSKAALDQLTRCASLELAAKGVRVNAVNPGVVVTEIHKRGGMTDEAYAAFLEHSKTTHPSRPHRTTGRDRIAGLISRFRPGVVDHRCNLLDRRRPCPNLCTVSAEKQQKQRGGAGDHLHLTLLHAPDILRDSMSTPAPTIVIRTSPQISAIRLVLAIVAGLVALLLGLLVLLLIGIETGPVALLLGLRDGDDSSSALHRPRLVDRSLRSRATLDAGHSFLLGRTDRNFLRFSSQHRQRNRGGITRR